MSAVPPPRASAISAGPGPAVALLLGTVLATGPAHAADDIGPPDSVAMGGASRGDLSGLMGVTTAPSILALAPRYELQGGAVLGPDKLVGARAYALDSNTGPVALGLAYHYSHSVPITDVGDLPGWVMPDDDLSNEQTRTLLEGGLATSFSDRRVGVGVSFGWAQRATRLTDTDAWFTGGASISGAIGLERELVLTAGIDNVLAPANDRAPMTWGLGLGLRPVPAFGFLADLDLVTGAFDRPVEVGFGGGLEGIAADVVAVRGGFRRSTDRDIDAATMGLGVMSDTVALDYAAELVVGHPWGRPAGWGQDKLRSYHHLALKLVF